LPFKLRGSCDIAMTLAPSRWSASSSASSPASNQAPRSAASWPVPEASTLGLLAAWLLRGRRR